MFSIKNKIFLITGGTGYLGKEMVKMLSNSGAQVFFTSTNIYKAQALCKELNLPSFFGLELDIRSKESINNCVETIISKFGKIDVLVNNAYFGYTDGFDKYSKEKWIQCFEGTVIGVDMMTQAVSEQMKSNKKGRIINISSMYGIVSPNPEVYKNESMINPIGYGVGKAGIIQYTKYAAMMLAKYNITVNSISYGPFPNLKIIKDKQFIYNLANKTFVKRVGKPKEAVSAIYFLSLDESSYITGQNIIVDGGWTSW